MRFDKPKVRCRVSAETSDGFDLCERPDTMGDATRTLDFLPDRQVMRPSFLSIRMVAGHSELSAAEQFLVAEADLNQRHNGQKILLVLFNPACRK